MLASLFSINACAMPLKSTYDSQTQTTKIINPLTTPVSVPFDITKKDNKLELQLKIKEEFGYVFELEFRYKDPERSQYDWVNILKSFFPNKKYGEEEFKEIMKDNRRVRELVGYEELIKDNSCLLTPETCLRESGLRGYRRKINPGVSTPIHLTITKIEQDKTETIIFDEVRGPEEADWSSAGFFKRITRLLLKSGAYKITAKTLKDAPEFIGTDIYLWMAKPPGKS